MALSKGWKVFLIVVGVMLIFGAIAGTVTGVVVYKSKHSNSSSDKAATEQHSAHNIDKKHSKQDEQNSLTPPNGETSHQSSIFTSDIGNNQNNNNQNIDSDTKVNVPEIVIKKLKLNLPMIRNDLERKKQKTGHWIWYGYPCLYSYGAGSQPLVSFYNREEVVAYLENDFTRSELQKTMTQTLNALSQHTKDAVYKVFDKFFNRSKSQTVDSFKVRVSCSIFSIVGEDVPEASEIKILADQILGYFDGTLSYNVDHGAFAGNKKLQGKDPDVANALKIHNQRS